MVNNGYISFVLENGGGFDVSGNPIEATKIQELKVSCNVSVVSRDYPIIVDGQAIQAKFSVYIDLRRIKLVDIQGIKEVNIYDSMDVLQGTFQVQNKEILTIANVLKIIV